MKSMQSMKNDMKTYHMPHLYQVVEPLGAWQPLFLEVQVEVEQPRLLLGVLVDQEHQDPLAEAGPRALYQVVSVEDQEPQDPPLAEAGLRALGHLL